MRRREFITLVGGAVIQRQFFGALRAVWTPMIAKGHSASLGGPTLRSPR
jgi:hypothetical protein